MFYRKDELVVHDYSSASFQSDINDSKSQLRQIFTLNNSVVS